jgi:outer membrane protein TolC
LAQTERRRFGQSTLSLWYGLEGLGESFDESRDLFRENRRGGYLSVRFLLPEPGLSADIGLARANLKIAQSAYEEACRTAEENLDLRLDEIRTLRETAELQSRRNRLLEDVVIIRREQYRTDLVSDQDLVDAEVETIQARVEYLETMRNINLAWVEVTLLSGSDPIADLMGGGSAAE